MRTHFGKIPEVVDLSRFVWRPFYELEGLEGTNSGENNVREKSYENIRWAKKYFSLT